LTAGRKTGFWEGDLEDHEAATMLSARPLQTVSRKIVQMQKRYQGIGFKVESDVKTAKLRSLAR
jgi:hypothetical protein